MRTPLLLTLAALLLSGCGLGETAATGAAQAKAQADQARQLQQQADQLKQQIDQANAQNQARLDAAEDATH
ncbi:MULTISPECIES: hypothetical protein [Pseudomonas]|uniref:hypothetical protein n=1 Tax=Pseudomonadaceae TaxID=135621 RepID=UPI00084AC155|nr:MULTISPECIES: hypothetical protein [Pseudomonas]OEC60009.1 hypothetical protein A9G05_08530 [Pseudomonas sp. ENNP23]